MKLTEKIGLLELNGKEYHLTKGETNTLAALLRHKVANISDIYEQVYKVRPNNNIGEYERRLIYMQLQRLKKKVPELEITRYYNYGYELRRD